MKPVDFSHRDKFPGTTGNGFDILLHRLVGLEKIPGLVFGLLLLLLAIPTTAPAWRETVVLWGFFLTDWLLISSLPKAEKSYGPSKPVVLMLAALRLVFSFLPLTYHIPIQALGTLLVVYGFWIEPHRIQVTHQKLVSRKLPSGFRLKILHLGDLHIERITDRERQLNQSIRELQPDLILFSGDFLNLSYLKDPSAWQAMCQVVSEWQAPLGVFSVSGSPAVDLEDVIPSQLKGLPIVHLPANRMTLQHQGQSLDLIGLGCTHKPHQDFPLLKELMDGHPDRFTILLYHSPDLAPEAAQTNIDLQLSGHTHGGQVRLPIFGALFTGSLYGKKFEAGRMQINDMALYITRGIGLEGASAPRVRFLCPPEIILWDITGIGSNS